MKLVPKLVLAGVSLALAVSTLDAKSASAAIINYAFTVDSPTSKGKGFFSFDDETFSNDNIPVAIVKSLSFQFDGDSTVYTAQDDINYPEFPVVFSTAFLPGQSSLGLDYLFDNKANPASDLSYEIVGENFTIFSRTSPNNEIISGTVSYTKVPEPTTATATLAVLSIGWMLNKKGKSLNQVKV